MIHPTHDPIPLRSTGMAQEAQICTCCASAVPEVLAQPCACPADDDQAVDFGAAIAALAVACATDDVAEVIHKAMALAALEKFATPDRCGHLGARITLRVKEKDGPYQYEVEIDDFDLEPARLALGPTATEALTTALRAHTPKGER